MRLLLDEISREKLFEKLKNSHKVKTYTELAKRLNISYSCIKKWRSGQNYISDSIIPANFKYRTLAVQENNWGCIKGGCTGIKVGGNPKYYNAFRRGGKKSIEKLRKWISQNRELHAKALRAGKISKVLNEVEHNTLVNKQYFTNEEVKLDLSSVSWSRNDEKRGVKLPKTLDPKLAEEIGIHIGDGTLPKKKYYYSVRGGYNEESYYRTYLFKLYKEIYGIDLNFIKRYDACGFEVSSKALYTFKSNALGLPVGEKMHRLAVPRIIFKSRDKEIFRAFLRGAFDTDGCVYAVPKRNYPRISITIKSKLLIEDMAKMLLLLGFKPAIYKYTIALNGLVMFKKWFKEIRSSNPKHLQRAKRIEEQMGPSSSLDLIAENNL